MVIFKKNKLSLSVVEAEINAFSHRFTLMKVNIFKKALLADDEYVFAPFNCQKSIVQTFNELFLMHGTWTSARYLKTF